MKGTRIFLKKKKTKSANMLVRDVEIFLKKKKKRDVNIIMNDITFLEGEKQRLIYYIKK